MDAQLRNFLRKFYAESSAYDETQNDRLRRWRNLEPESAELLAALVRMARPTTVLELGTSNGYSTCWLADAVRDLQARLVSVEIDPARAALAEQTLDQADLSGCAEIVTADAGEHLASLPDQSIDFCFLDAERPHYVGYWPDLKRVLSPGGTLVVDNVLSHADQVTKLLPMVTAEWFCTTVSSGAGLFVAVKPRG